VEFYLMKKILMNCVMIFFSFCLIGCASNLKNISTTGVGAASGAAVAALTGNPLMVLGGAVVGGAIGHYATKIKK
jgi:hypothetical protein